MATPEYQQEFNDIIERIKEGTYKEEVLSINNKELTDEDAAELCETIRVATEAGICNIIKLSLSRNQLKTIDVNRLTQLKSLDLSYNQLKTINVKGLTQLEWLDLCDNQLKTIDVAGLTQLGWLYLAGNQLKTINVKGLTQLKWLRLYGNQLTCLTHAKLSSFLTDGYFHFAPCNDIMKLAPEEQTKVNNEFNQKVAWATRQFLIGEQSDVIESELQSQIEKDEGLLLKPEDSVYIMSEASIQAAERIAKQRKKYSEAIQDDLFLFLLPEFMNEEIIQYAALYSQNENENENALIARSFCHIL